MLKKTCLAGAFGAMLLFGAAANGQPLQNGDFETVNPTDGTLPLGWNPFNGAQRRTVGDGLLPPLTAAHSGVAAIDFTPRPVGPSDFLGFSSDALLDPTDPVSPRNNPGYTFDPPNGPDIVVSGWFMIPASDPMVRHFTGLKLEFRRTENNSVYEGFEWRFADANNPAATPALTAVTTPTGPGIHTNGQWIHATATFHQSQFTIPLWPLPPVNPDAKVSVLPLRFGDPYVVGGRGTVFWDDISFTQVVPCAADFNHSGAVTVQDIFDFLAAYFSSSPTADINNSGAVTVQDIFDYLALYFVGC
jgi:hypothetical protein